jgi:glycosyltransferase involved in cell wall biosynthesis
MRIFYDGEIYAFYAKQSGGISRYFDNLISRLPDDFYPILTTGRSKQGSHPQHPNLTIHRYTLDFKPIRINHWIRAKYFQSIYQKSNAQIAHPSYYSLVTGREMSEYRCPVVVTVHDLIHELFPDALDPHGYMAEVKRKAVFSASAIVCVSESTKRDLLARYPELADRITVILEATELDETYICDEDPVPSRPYYLYVGARNGYKNFDRLLMAFARVNAKFPDLALCIVGAPFSKEENRRIDELHLTASIEHYGKASDRQLAKLYNRSIALVYPSLYEGFGIPPLEAMACGTAVIAADRSSIPEVVGDAGLLFDPESTDELIDRMLFLLDQSCERAATIDRGKERVQKFSWDRTAMQTAELYRSLI